MDRETLLGEHGTRKYLGHFAGHAGRLPWVNIPEDPPEGTKQTLGIFAAGPRVPVVNPGCPVEIGDTVRFKPAAYFTGTGGLGMELDVVVEATVIQIHEEHRWYRAEWRTAGGRILRESFKF